MGPDVTFTFHPIGATAGGNLAIVFIRERARGVRQILVNNPHSYTVGTSCRIATPSATKAPALTLALIIAPNLAQECTVVAFAPTQATAYEVTLYDLKGARIKTIGTGRASADKTVNLPLNTDELANGIYLVKLTTGRTVVTQRLVMSH